MPAKKLSLAEECPLINCDIIKLEGLSRTQIRLLHDAKSDVAKLLSVLYEKVPQERADDAIRDWLKKVL